MRPVRRLALATLAAVAMTVFVTWPQSAALSSAFASHVDPYFSAWRLMWIAHALRTDPLHLFDTNIFHPATGSLAYSDPVLLEGVIATPFLWLNVSPILVYNVLLLLGFVASGVAMFVLVRHLTGQTAAAVVAMGVFTMAPYRIEHFMHLELQWTMWMPLAFWALHRTVEARSWRFGVLSGLFVWLQIVSSVYYGIFLVLMVVVVAPWLLLRSPRGPFDALPPLAAGGAVAVLLTIPYMLPFVRTARDLGLRDLYEVVRFSALPTDYLAAVDVNRLWGWTARLVGGDERRLYPGVVAVVLAAFAFLRRPRRDAWLYLAVALLAFDMSLGMNGIVYAFLFNHVPALAGLRAPARFAILAQCGLAVLAGLGVAGIAERMAAARRGASSTVAVAALVLLAADYANRPMNLYAEVPPNPAAFDVYHAIRAQGPGVVIELPMPTLNTLPGQDALYAYWSAEHWHKLVNGYSGYYPDVYAETLNRMETFPDDESVARLKRMDVRYLVVHRDMYEGTKYSSLLYQLMNRREFTHLGTFTDPAKGEAQLFRLESARP